MASRRAAFSGNTSLIATFYSVIRLYDTRDLSLCKLLKR